MAMDKKNLIELYKITREEAYHHDTINMQIYLALGLVISLFLAAIGFLFAQDFPLRYLCWAKVGIFLLFFFVETYFYLAFRRITKYFGTCDEVCKAIEEKLQNIKQEDVASEWDSLLVTKKLRNGTHENMYLGNKFILMAIISLIAMGLLLFVFIE